MSRSLPNLASVTTIAPDGSRRFLHPADVKGRFTSWRRIVALFLVLVYILLPWIPVNGYPAVFLDVAGRLPGSPRHRVTPWRAGTTAGRNRSMSRPSQIRTFVLSETKSEHGAEDDPRRR